MAEHKKEVFRRAYLIVFIKRKLTSFRQIETSIKNTEVNEIEKSILKEAALPFQYDEDPEELMEKQAFKDFANIWFESIFIETLPQPKNLGSLVADISDIIADDSERSFTKTANEVRAWLMEEINNKLPDHIDSRISTIVTGVS